MVVVLTADVGFGWTLLCRQLLPAGSGPTAGADEQLCCARHSTKQRLCSRSQVCH